MTERDGFGSSGEQKSPVTTAREQTSQVGHEAVRAGGDVVHTAAEQGKHLVQESGRQIRHLVGEATNQVREQAIVQQQRAVDGLRGIGQELRAMAEHDGQSGLASELASQASTRIEQLADWLERREPGDLLMELRNFARRRPGMFLASAVVAGVLVGRLTRSLTSSGDSGMAEGGRAQNPAWPPDATPGMETSTPVGVSAPQTPTTPGYGPGGYGQNPTYGQAQPPPPRYAPGGGLGAGLTEPTYEQATPEGNLYRSSTASSDEAENRRRP